MDITPEEVKKAMKKCLERYGKVLKILAKYDEVGDMELARKLVDEEENNNKNS